jgi:hypothetical protein
MPISSCTAALCSKSSQARRTNVKHA